MAKKKDSSTGIGASKLKNMLNKMSGDSLVIDLSTESGSNEIDVKDWISTGSTLLDMSIKREGYGGIPVGKISSIAGLSSTGKSFLAIQIAKNAQEKGMTVVYFDSEAAIDSTFLARGGLDLEELVYIRPDNLEQVIEIIEETLKEISNERVLFIWDSLAFSETKGALDTELNLNGAITAKPRLLSKAMNRILVPLAKKKSALLVLNQLRNRIPQGPMDHSVKSNPYFTPGGNALKYAYSLEIWLTGRTAKAARKLDASGNTVGAEVVATIKKSRFGTPNRQATFFIEWGDRVGVADEDSWFDALVAVGGDLFVKEGHRYKMSMSDTDPDDWSIKFFASQWSEQCKNPVFLSRAKEILERNYAKCAIEDINAILEEAEIEYEGE